MVRPGLAAKVGNFCDLCNFLSIFPPKSCQGAGRAAPAPCFGWAKNLSRYYIYIMSVFCFPL